MKEFDNICKDGKGRTGNVLVHRALRPALIGFCLIRNLLNGKKMKKENRKRKNVMNVYLDDIEYKQIIDSSVYAGLSISTFARSVCLGAKVESREDSKAIRELLKINADLGRLGGLLKLGIVECGQAQDFRPLLKEIEKRQFELQRAIQKL